MALKDWKTSFLGKKLKRKALASARTSVPSRKKRSFTAKAIFAP